MVYLHRLPARFFFVFKTVRKLSASRKITPGTIKQKGMQMKKRVMDNSRILKELKKLTRNAIAVLNESRGARSSHEAGELRKSLQKILVGKEEKSEKAFMRELLSALKEVAEYANDPQRSSKSEKFKELGDEISEFLEEIGMKNKPTNGG